MYEVPLHFDRQRPSTPGAEGRPAQRARRAAAGFTLVELITTIAIIAILVSLVTVAFTSATHNAKMAAARNTIVTHAQLARSYAIANQIETMMVVNPYNNRIELWHLNTNETGGTWDPMSTYDPAAFASFPPSSALGNPQRADGYAYTSVFDSGAQLPKEVAVHPVDFYDEVTGTEQRPFSGADPNERKMDNLTWPAFCFDPHGRMIIRTRRIATRSYRMRNGSPRSEPNRLPDGTPDLSIIGNPTLPLAYRYLVWGTLSEQGGPDRGDTPITSTYGFILSDADKMRRFTGDNPTPAQLVNNWLRLTYDNTVYGDERDDIRDPEFSQKVLLNRFSGEELAEAEPD